MMKTMTALAMLLAASLAQAFELEVSAQHAVLPAEQVRAMVLETAESIGHRIPDEPAIKVVVTAKARPSSVSGGQLYYHRVQLKKAFSGGPPYPLRAWLPIKSVEHYGIAPGDQLRDKLAGTLRQFFSDLLAVDPQTQAP